MLRRDRQRRGRETVLIKLAFVATHVAHLRSPSIDLVYARSVANYNVFYSHSGKGTAVSCSLISTDNFTSVFRFVDATSNCHHDDDLNVYSILYTLVHLVLPKELHYWVGGITFFSQLTQSSISCALTE